MYLELLLALRKVETAVGQNLTSGVPDCPCKGANTIQNLGEEGFYKWCVVRELSSSSARD